MSELTDAQAAETLRALAGQLRGSSRSTEAQWCDDAAQRLEASEVRITEQDAEIDEMIRKAISREVEQENLRARIAELEKALKDTLRMLEAAYRQLGMWSKDNPRIRNASAVLTKGETPEREG